MEDLTRVVEELRPPPILVVGDLIIDTYVEGKAGRVSPEAPATCSAARATWRRT
jgi:bifunctional ADP-heptose synthase (sugar kinase/adenylyltransferase)